MRVSLPFVSFIAVSLITTSLASVDVLLASDKNCNKSEDHNFYTVMEQHSNYFIEEISVRCLSLLDSDQVYVWLLTIIAAGVVGASSIFPLFIISLANDENCLANKDSPKSTLKYLLSFAVGGLLGDVFLHLLPESWNQMVNSGIPLNSVQITMGFWILCGVFTFSLIESIFSHVNAKDDTKEENTKEALSYHINGNANNNYTNGHLNGKFNKLDDSQLKLRNGHVKNVNNEPNGLSNGHLSTDKKGHDDVANLLDDTRNQINITGYLNLLANGIDNFTHGIAVGASFLVGIKVGILTTLAIIIHEIPHEIGDFAILIKSGFSKWEAVKAQASIAIITILGAILTLWANSADLIGTKTAWILPFTSGGFLHIALVSILPDLMNETNLAQSIRQSFCIGLGIMITALVNFTIE